MSPVTDNSVRIETVLPLQQRLEHEQHTRTYFRCAKCGRSQRFSWFRAYCNEAAELLCWGCNGGTRYRLCRRCRQPRRLEQFGCGAIAPCDSSICYGCRTAKPPTKDPLQPTCSRCETTFTAKRADAKFCSAKCRTAAHRANTKDNRHD